MSAPPDAHAGAHTDAGEQRSRENVAASWFAVALAFCLGGAGVVIAALAVGAQRAWQGRDTARTAESRRQSVADHRAWLDRDAKARTAWREARRAWWAGGAVGDPPAQPSRAARFGAWWRRMWARASVVADRFDEGFRDGWAAADAARRDGAGWREVARTRPSEGDPDVPGEPTTGPDAPTAPKEPRSTQEDPPTTEPENVPPPTTTEPTPEPDPPTNISPTQQEEPMTAPTQTGPAGETHLDLTAAGLSAINQKVAAINDQVDALAADRAELAAMVAAEAERVAANGGTADTTAALDAANAVVAQLGQHLGGVSEAATEAADQTAAAHAGLAPARDAQDALHSAGARGEFVSTATSD